MGVSVCEEERLDNCRICISSWRNARFGYEVPETIYTYNLLRGVNFEVLPLSSNALGTTMLPLLGTFLELLL
jgi:hypothetical protein